MRVSRLLTVAATVAACSFAGVARAATITIVNANAAGVGFNDPTPATPVGGNPGTTKGQQALNVFKRGAEIWGATLKSGIEIKISASLTALTCTATTATLGSAGPVGFNFNFAGAPVADTLFPYALANAIANTDLVTTGADITARFNSNLGTTNCLPGSPFYLGLDHNQPGQQFDLLATLLPELGHALGFLTAVNSSTGVRLQKRKDIL
jgi:hypothetical protein